MFRLYLPHVFPQFDAKFITYVFQFKHNIGNVSGVDIVSKHKSHNSVYVRFESINDHLSHVRRLFERINSNEKVSINYQGKYYWNILKDTSSGKNFTQCERKECIVLNDFSSSHSHFSMKNNMFFSDLVKNNGLLQHKRLDFIKQHDSFNANT